MRASRFVGSALLVVAACKGERATPPSTSGSGSGSSGSAGSAAPVAALDAQPADAAIACVPRGDVGLAASERVTICGEKDCIAVDPKTGAAAATPHVDTPAPALTAAKIEERDGKLVACFKDRCRDVGTNAKSAIAAAKDTKREELAATVDLAALVIPGAAPQVWDLAKDRKIDLESPSAQQGLGEVRAVGNDLYAVFTPPVERVYRSNGKPLDKLAAEGSPLAMVDDTHWAALTPDQTLHIFGEPAHRIELVSSLGFDDWEAGGSLGTLPDGNLAVLLTRTREASVVIVDPRRGTVFARWPLTRCP